MNCPKCGCYCKDTEVKCPSCGAYVEFVANTDSSGKLDNLFANSGKILKVLAKVVFIGGIIASVIMAIISFVEAGNYSDAPWMSSRESDALYSSYITSGFVYLIVGPIASFLSATSTYAIGYIFDKVTEIKEKLR
ncbi:MAG: hypothetical protein IKU84_00645 [Clostridia bacterium]|nr:hypothetical protein [Clostridia bacterium]